MGKDYFSSKLRNKEIDVVFQAKVKKAYEVAKIK